MALQQNTCDIKVRARSKIKYLKNIYIYVKGNNKSNLTEKKKKENFPVEWYYVPMYTRRQYKMKCKENSNVKRLEFY